ncbi:MAG TPA: OmpA family protein [Bryobacteraceae bacterium]|nr:OmpA family protein [Bryobacteraceae bacterium]
MRRSSGADYLAHSFTDLMTSLMVIFILLLLVFLNNKAAVNENVTNSLLKDLKVQLQQGKFQQENIRLDQKDRYTIVMEIPDQLMTFKTNEYELKPEGEAFLASHASLLAGILCSDKYRNSIENIIVEGHTDSAPYRGATPEQSQQLNLKLSQDRSMEVVKKTLLYLNGMPRQRACLLQKLSATGRGEQDLKSTAEKSRRVVFKIRVNSSLGSELANELGARLR